MKGISKTVQFYLLISQLQRLRPGRGADVLIITQLLRARSCTASQDSGTTSLPSRLSIAPFNFPQQLRRSQSSSIFFFMLPAGNNWHL